MKKIITVTLALGLTSLLMAEANIPLDKKAMRAKIEKIAGKVSPFNKVVQNILTKEQREKVGAYVKATKGK
jgi:hypothetical protein